MGPFEFLWNLQEPMNAHDASESPRNLARQVDCSPGFDAFTENGQPSAVASPPVEGSVASRRIDAALTPLTPSERNVLRLLLDGRPNKSIAKQLSMGLRTVELRRANLMRKMGARSLAELVRQALAAGLDRPGDVED